MHKKTFIKNLIGFVGCIMEVIPKKMISKGYARKPNIYIHTSLIDFLFFIFILIFLHICYFSRSTKECTKQLLSKNNILLDLLVDIMKVIPNKK